MLKDERLYVTLLILGWYTTSISLGLYNTYLFSAANGDFKFPLLTTMMHSWTHFLISLVLNKLHKKGEAVETSFKDYFTKIMPCGLATGLDIGLSNSSLRYITPSFYTMIKSGAPVFILMFAILFRLEQINLKLVGSIFVICLGVFVMVMNETKFELGGYLMVQFATIISGLRWTLTQLLLKNSKLGLDDPISTMMMIAPCVGGMLMVWGSFVEGFGSFLGGIEASGNSTLLVLSIFGGSVIAFLMILIEFELVRSTSAVTLSIAGIFKEILTITFSVIVFKDLFTVNMIVGLIISLVGIAGLLLLIGYNYIRIFEKRDDGYNELDLSDLSDFESDLLAD